VHDTKKFIKEAAATTVVTGLLLAAANGTKRLNTLLAYQDSSRTASAYQDLLRTNQRVNELKRKGYKVIDEGKLAEYYKGNKDPSPVILPQFFENRAINKCGENGMAAKVEVIKLKRNLSNDAIAVKCVPIDPARK
jgi:hypothetical protein